MLQNVKEIESEIDKEDIRSGDKLKLARRPRMNFEVLGIPVGAILKYKNGGAEVKSQNSFHLYNGGATNSDYTANISYTQPVAGWYHIVMLASLPNIAMYINGASIGSATFSGGGTTTNPNHNYPLYLGEGPYGNFIHTSFKMDNVRFFDRALTASEINTLYTNEKKP